MALNTGNNDGQIAIDGRGDEKDRLLDRLFAWKAGEAWREVVVVCGAADAGGGREGLRSACELEVGRKTVFSLSDVDEMDDVRQPVVSLCYDASAAQSPV